MPKCSAEHLEVTHFQGAKKANEGSQTFSRGFQFGLNRNLVCDRAGVDQIDYCFNLWDTTPCTPDGDAGICPDGRTVHKISWNILGTLLTAQGPYRFCGVLNKQNIDTLGSSVVLMNIAQNTIKDDPSNKVIILMDTGQLSYLEIIDDD